MTPEEIAKIRQELENKYQALATKNPRYEKLPVEMKRPGYRLFQAKRNTGFRGMTWFKAGEYGLGAINSEGEVSTFSFGTSIGEHLIGACRLPNTNAIRWIEPEPLVLLKTRPALPEGEYLTGWANGKATFGPRDQAYQLSWGAVWTQVPILTQAMPGHKFYGERP